MVGYKNISWVKENEDEMDVLKINWFVDLGMGITFAVSFITGLLKFSVPVAAARDKRCYSSGCVNF